MRIYTSQDAIKKRKEDGTEVLYFLFDEYEVHWNRINPGVAQNWHWHKRINEVLLVIQGHIRVNWISRGRKTSRVLNSGNLVEFGKAVHSIENSGKTPAVFIIIKLILAGNSKRRIFKSDKFTVQPDLIPRRFRGAK